MVKAKKSVLDKIAMILVIIGAINWGLIGAFSWDLVQWITFSTVWLARVIYGLVGLSGLWMIYAMNKK